jgi:hypothetical protein
LGFKIWVLGTVARQNNQTKINNVVGVSLALSSGFNRGFLIKIAKDLIIF